jgi:hypothetical protein
MVFSGLASKPVATVFFGLASKPVAQVSRFGDFSLKITVTVSWFGSQIQASFSLSVVPQNRWREDDM